MPKTLDEYMKGDFPKNCVKVILDIEKEKKYESLFDKIMDELEDMKLIDKNILMKFKDEYFPYFQSLIELMVKEMKGFTDNYMMYILNEGNQLKILNQLVSSGNPS